MAITYNVSKCPKGFGVYVRALSGNELQELRDLMPELGDSVVSGGIPVSSGRLTRKPTELQALKALKNIASKSIPDQIAKIRKVTLRPLTKENEVIKLNYFQLHREFGKKGDTIKHFTTQDKGFAESVATQYAERGVNATLHKTIGRTLKLSKQDANKAREIGEIKLNKLEGTNGVATTASLIINDVLAGKKKIKPGLIGPNMKRETRKLIPLSEWKAKQGL